jgi:putative heme iron utilization protein
MQRAAGQFSLSRRSCNVYSPQRLSKTILLARQFAHVDATEATMTAVDRLGFHVRLKTPEAMRGARIAFLREVSNPAEARKVLVEMVQQARSQAE